MFLSFQISGWLFALDQRKVNNFQFVQFFFLMYAQNDSLQVLYKLEEIPESIFYGTFFTIFLLTVFSFHFQNFNSSDIADYGFILSPFFFFFWFNSIFVILPGRVLKFIFKMILNVYLKKR